MSKRHLPLALVVGVLIACSSQAELTLNVMSFNVRYGTANDGANAWSNRKDIVIDCIRQYDPDIIGMQECLDFQGDYIVQQIPDYAHFSVAREADGSGERMTIFYKRKLLAPMETGNFWLSESPDVPGSRSWDSACPRMVTWARFYHYGEKRFFYHFNTHFDHMSEKARQASANLLLKYVNDIAGEDVPVVITADFNAAAEQTDPWRTITGGGFTDAWVAAQERVGPPITFGPWKAPEEGVDNRIDWILFNKHLASHRCETVLFNRDGRYPTDHYPVIARLVEASH